MIEKSGFQFCPVLERVFAETGPNDPLHEEGISGLRLGKLLVTRILFEGGRLDNELVKDLLRIPSDIVLLDSSLAGLWHPTAKWCSLVNLSCPIIRVNPCFADETDTIPSSPVVKRLPELILCPRDFDGPWNKKCDHARYYVEPSVFHGRAANDFPWDWILPGRVLVYCSLGTQSSEYPEALAVLRAVTESVRRLPSIQLIVAAGCHLDSLAATGLPDNVLVRKSVPQIELLSRCRAVVTHGGLGTVKEALITAVPIVAIPFIHDQPLNAARIEYHEVGVALALSEMSSGMVAAALCDVIDNKLIHERCRQIQEVFRRIEAESPSLEHIEARLQ